MFSNINIVPIQLGNGENPCRLKSTLEKKKENPTLGCTDFEFTTVRVLQNQVAHFLEDLCTDFRMKYTGSK
jgi:hypothetical protein